MKTTLEFVGFVWLADRMVSFIRENHKKWQDTPDQKLYEYLAWFWGKDLLAVSFCGEEINGVCTIKLFDQLEDFLSPKAFNPTGKFCMVDLLVATNPMAIANCFEKLFARWGPQEIMLWDRNERTEKGAPRMFTWEQYLKLTRRLTYGLVERIN
jgi:hypothetical protein